MYVTTTNEKRGHEFKTAREGLWKGLDEGKLKEKGCNYIIASHKKNNFLQKTLISNDHVLLGYCIS